jgi:hypothetical protein
VSTPVVPFTATALPLTPATRLTPADDQVAGWAPVESAAMAPEVSSIFHWPASRGTCCSSPGSSTRSYARTASIRPGQYSPKAPATCDRPIWNTPVAAHGVVNAVVASSAPFTYSRICPAVAS